jgi:hypothetical protein
MMNLRRWFVHFNFKADRSPDEPNMQGINEICFDYLRPLDASRSSTAKTSLFGSLELRI